ncbi:hypothetical protein TNCV_3876741 [Trichonephila clavipes]|uniref:Uncharacterized protein n=1 Tax=Trichonephila clavipes TaxID=2585209 RepID=A0A8X6ST26_TRICX|nr:hypothetical protein TNCV_3876741 [Trichonephila clavipes]
MFPLGGLVPFDPRTGIGWWMGVEDYCSRVHDHLMKLMKGSNFFLDAVLNVSNNSDEAHFWLNGYVNKQNCRIWSEANTQVYVETPLRPEKLTVWCALWAGGILLQKR